MYKTILARTTLTLRLLPMYTQILIFRGQIKDHLFQAAFPLLPWPPLQLASTTSIINDPDLVFLFSAHVIYAMDYSLILDC